MNNETFKVGEIAIYVCSDHHSEYNGQECTVDSPLGWRFPKNVVTGQLMEVYGYRTIAQDGTIFTCRPEQLKKRRPPQDWQTLCNLQDKPVDAPTRELECA